MIAYKNIPHELKKLNRWVCTRNKIPYQATREKRASSTNPKTWSSFDDAVAAVSRFGYDGIGFVFNGDGYIGIDIDIKTNNSDEVTRLKKITYDIVHRCKSYTELSVSGRGYHIIVKGDLPFTGKDNMSGVEIYKNGRYFVMTGNQLQYSEIIENQSAIDYIVETYFPNIVRARNNSYKIEALYQPIYRLPQDGKIYLKPEYPMIPNGHRNNSLTSLAGQLRARGHTRRQILKELLHCNTIACNPPLAEQEILSIVNSVMRYER